jgi:hypothetical protein
VYDFTRDDHLDLEAIRKRIAGMSDAQLLEYDRCGIVERGGAESGAADCCIVPRGAARDRALRPGDPLPQSRLARRPNAS